MSALVNKTQREKQLNRRLELNGELKKLKQERNAERPTMRYDVLGFTPKTGQWRDSKEKADVAVDNYRKYQAEYEIRMTLEEYSETTGITDFIRRIPNGAGKNGGVQHCVAPSDTSLRASNWTDIEVSQIGKRIDLPFDNPKSKQLIMELDFLIFGCF
jgi:adenine-specific DNA-methyltransferase